jgi:hypothetical protein
LDEQHDLHAARVGTSVALWTLVPIAIGWWRVARSNVQ